MGFRAEMEIYNNLIKHFLHYSQHKLQKNRLRLQWNPVMDTLWYLSLICLKTDFTFTVDGDCQQQISFGFCSGYCHSCLMRNAIRSKSTNLMIVFHIIALLRYSFRQGIFSIRWLNKWEPSIWYILRFSPDFNFFISIFSLNFFHSNFKVARTKPVCAAP